MCSAPPQGATANIKGMLYANNMEMITYCRELPRAD